MKHVFALAVVLALGACSREPESNASRPGSKPTAAAPAGNDSVAAVALTPGKHPVFVRFVLEGKPKVGVVGQVKLELAGEPGPVALHLQAAGAIVDPATALLTISDGGDPVSQSIAITPQTAGIAELQVRVRQAAEGAQEIAYAIPLLIEK